MAMPLACVRPALTPSLPPTTSPLTQIEYSNNVWIDHCDVSSDRDHDKDYYDGLIDVRNPQSH